jgi:hypothetical protein
MTEYSDTPVLEFYLRSGVHYRHRGIPLDFCFQDILWWTDGTLERKHDYIQWFFPLDTSSGCNLNAPVLTPYEILQFRRVKSLRKQQLIAFRRMLKFYGLRYLFGVVFRASNFDKRASVWIDPYANLNHNYLRLTRIITSLTLLGNGKQAKALVKFLLKIHVREEVTFPEETLVFWRAAYNKLKG